MSPSRATFAAQLLAAMPASAVTGVTASAERLLGQLPNRHDLAANVALVGYGGGKDSTYMLAFVRAIQLLIAEQHGSTFRMRVATNRHAGMPQAVMENIHRAYQALGLYDDDCELLLVEGTDVLEFAVERPLPAHVVERNRLDILMTGHRTHAEARPTFCNACNISMVNAFGLAAAHGCGVDVIITGDSPAEQRMYRAWVRRLARRASHGAAKTPGFKGLLEDVRRIETIYRDDIHGSTGLAAAPQSWHAGEVPDELAYFSVYGDTEYAAGDHWDLLTGFLGFRFDDIAFSFTESDCGNPGLMAHLRGLRSERLEQGTYEDGLDAYIAFAIELMSEKDFPVALIDVMRGRYADRPAKLRMRAAMEAYARQAFGLGEEELIAMVYSPFVDRAARLDQFLAREHPRLFELRSSVHDLLDGDVASTGPIDEVRRAVERISGLPLARLRRLYQRSLETFPTAGGDTLLANILRGDPHKRPHGDGFITGR
jgi:hypothetical protein